MNPPGRCPTGQCHSSLPYPYDPRMAPKCLRRMRAHRASGEGLADLGPEAAAGATATWFSAAEYRTPGGLPESGRHIAPVCRGDRGSTRRRHALPAGITGPRPGRFGHGPCSRIGQQVAEGTALLLDDAEELRVIARPPPAFGGRQRAPRSGSPARRKAWPDPGRTPRLARRLRPRKRYGGRRASSRSTTRRACR